MAPTARAGKTYTVEPQNGFTAAFDQAGWSPAQKTHSLKNTSSGWVVWHANAGAGLVTCQPPAGWLASAQTVTVTVTPAPTASARPTGTYADNITFDWQIRVLSDINGDSVVDVLDLLALQTAFGSGVGDPNYEPLCDFDGDGSVGILDLLDLIAMFGHRDRVKVWPVVVAPGPARGRLPKCQVDAGKTDHRAALHQVPEAAGTEAELLRRIDTIDFWFYVPRGVGRVRLHKYVHLYLMACRSGDLRHHDKRPGGSTSTRRSRTSRLRTNGRWSRRPGG